MDDPLRILAQADNPPTGEIMLLAAVLAAAVLLLGVIAMWLRRRYLSGASSEAGEAMTLADLRDLHRSGQLSDEEFDKAKARMIAQYRGQLREAAETDQAGEDEPDNHHKS